MKQAKQNKSRELRILALYKSLNKKASNDPVVYSESLLDMFKKTPPRPE